MKGGTCTVSVQEEAAEIFSLFFTVNSQREYTLEINFLLLELDVGSCLMCSASVWPRFNKTLKSMADFIHMGI